MTQSQPHSFRHAVEAGDLEAIVATLSPDVVFHSPVVHRPIVGRAGVTSLLEAVVATFQDFRYTQEFHDGPRSALVFEARVGDRSLQGVDLLEHDEHGLIERLTVMVRPLSGLTALSDAVRTRLEHDTTQ
jgi:SnoaL-like domain